MDWHFPLSKYISKGKLGGCCKQLYSIKSYWKVKNESFVFLEGLFSECWWDMALPSGNNWHLHCPSLRWGQVHLLALKPHQLLSVGGKGTACLIRLDKMLRSKTPTEKAVNPLGAGMAAAFIFLPIHELILHTLPVLAVEKSLAQLCMNHLREDNLLSFSAGWNKLIRALHG